MSQVKRLFVEKKKGCDVEAGMLFNDIKENLGIDGLKSVRIVNRYDVSGIADRDYERAVHTVFSEPPVDIIYDENIDAGSSRVFAVEYLPGQYDQRADSAAQCIQIMTMGERPEVKTARLIILEGLISDEEFRKIKSYCINPVDSREASLEKPLTLSSEINIPESVDTVDGFIDADRPGLEKLKESMGFAMDVEDLLFCQSYFRDNEKRNPTVTEIKVIDTYWSDHCRHTTFLTELKDIKIEDGPYAGIIKEVYENYLESRKFVYGDRVRDINLMDIATIAMKELKLRGKIPDLDESEEINACSIVVEVDADGKKEEWLVMFKNETHNHPTEIEPFGGAATCLGGAIRDPLSGRAYVYQAMRVTGSGDPRTKIEDTLPGKLPQRKITTGAAAGYSSYGNQIGLATGQVSEVYDEGFVAKRMEVGAVIGAVPKKNVVRKVPCEGDVIILLGGRTGRDGCGGATGSSKEHNEKSILNCGAEVQKGNPPTERKIQRLFRKPEVSLLIKRCNDFGAGGVSVAIGELADGLLINLNAVPKKYEGLDGTELAISESQERMAVVVDRKDAEKFMEYSREENLEAVVVAEVTSDSRLRMVWNEKIIVNISREFLNTNGAKQSTDAVIASPTGTVFNKEHDGYSRNSIWDEWLKNLGSLNVCSQRGLSERFDSTIGAGTVLMPFGGKYQLTPAECMAAKIPVLTGDTSTGTLMSFGYNPKLSKRSPFHGAFYAVIEAVTKIVSAGGDYKSIRLTLQEYFEKPGKDPVKWGKPLSALLGSYYAQMKLNLPAIGGKDSMSGTFNDLNVPPTLVAFAVDAADVKKIVSPEFKKAGSSVVLLKPLRDENELPVIDSLKRIYTKVNGLINDGKVLSSHTIGIGGIAGAVSKMAFGNKIGIKFGSSIGDINLFEPDYGSILLELDEKENLDSLFEGIDYILLGQTQSKGAIDIRDISIDLDEALESYEKPLEKVFPARVKHTYSNIPSIEYSMRNTVRPKLQFAKPRVFIPVFPGTNCEYDTARAFERAGGIVDTFVINNLSPSEIEASIREMAGRIKNSQIIALPGGFSGGDEPDGSGKFIAAAFRNPSAADAVMELLNNRDGLILGICNGFQALIKLGLLPYGKIVDMKDDSPTLTFNSIGRHMSRMVNTKVVSVMSPWLSGVNEGDIHTVAISHGEGRFTANQEDIEIMVKNGQVATQYVNQYGEPGYDIESNPNGSVFAIEGITSPDGRIFGKMGHSERAGINIAVNVPGEKNQKIFESGINYFK